jgi:uroporphyrinogen-III synthase
VPQDPSDSPRSLLLTGPIGQLAVWSAAVVAAGWQPIAWPLLTLEPRAFDWPQLRPDWLIVTSAQALPALKLHRQHLIGQPFAAVGKRSAAALRNLGAQEVLPAADNSRILLTRLKPRVLPGQTALWPHGPKSTLLARQLAELGLKVTAPQAYAEAPQLPTARHPAPPATTSTVFLASPSAVERLLEFPPPVGGWNAIAIGPSTAHACRQAQQRGAPLLTIRELSSPQPDALTQQLLGPSQ